MNNFQASSADGASFQSRPFVQISQPAKPPPRFDLYWNFQSVVFQVEGTLFSVWKNGFFVKGTPFETMFSLPPGDNKSIEGSSADKPIILEGTSAEDFRVFLRVLYPLGVLPVTEYSHWLGVLRLAHKWEFVEIRKKAVTALTPRLSSKPSEDKIRLGNEFHVREWLKEGLVDIVHRKDLEISMLQRSPYNFDNERILKIFYIQSKAWQKFEGYCNRYSSNSSFVTYIKDLVEQLFATELKAIEYHSSQQE